jgi:hypothetical protein
MSQERTLTMDNSKTCPKCRQTKPLHEWGKNKSKKDGLSSECKSCHASDVAKWRKANPEEQKRRSRAQHDKNKEKSNEARRANYRANEDRERKQRKSYYEKTAEKQKQSSKEWRINNPEKARSQGRRIRAMRASVYTEDYSTDQVLERWGINCHLCGLPIDLLAPRSTHAKGWELGLQLDHVIPLSSGGPDTLENVKPSHGKCNIAKGYRRIKD